MKYKLGQVGLNRHPEIYTSGTEDRMNMKVLSTVEEELAMWKAAEKIVELIEHLTIQQAYFVWHYVNAMKGLDTQEELSMYKWLEYRAFVSRSNDRTQSKEDKEITQKILKKALEKKNKK